MTEFIRWLASTIGLYWSWMADTMVPGCGFSFAALFLFILVFNFGIFILKIVFSGDTKGGTKDVKNMRK